MGNKFSEKKYFKQIRRHFMLTSEKSIIKHHCSPVETNLKFPENKNRTKNFKVKDAGLTYYMKTDNKTFVKGWTFVENLQQKFHAKTKLNPVDLFNFTFGVTLVIDRIRTKIYSNIENKIKNYSKCLTGILKNPGKFSNVKIFKNDEVNCVICKKNIRSKICNIGTKFYHENCLPKGK